MTRQNAMITQHRCSTHTRNTLGVFVGKTRSRFEQVCEMGTGRNHADFDTPREHLLRHTRNRTCDQRITREMNVNVRKRKVNTEARRAEVRLRSYELHFTTPIAIPKHLELFPSYNSSPSCLKILWRSRPNLNFNTSVQFKNQCIVLKLYWTNTLTNDAFGGAQNGNIQFFERQMHKRRKHRNIESSPKKPQRFCAKSEPAVWI